MRAVSWLSVIGAFAILLGTFVMVADSWNWFHALYSDLTSFGAIEEGWQSLTAYSMEDSGGREFGGLRRGESGFSELLRLVQEYRPDLAVHETSWIVCTTGMAYNIGSVSIRDEYISVVKEGSAVPDGLATKEAVEQWLQTARLRSLLKLGFLIVMAGVCFGLPTLIAQAIRR